MLGIFFGEIGMFRRNTPVNAKTGIKNTDATISLGMIKIITFVLEHGCLGENGKTMGKATWDKELPMVVFRELNGNVLSISRRALANVDSDIQDPASYTPNHFTLREGRTLEMETTHHSI